MNLYLDIDKYANQLNKQITEESKIEHVVESTGPQLPSAQDATPDAGDKFHLT